MRVTGTAVPAARAALLDPIYMVSRSNRRGIVAANQEEPAPTTQRGASGAKPYSVPKPTEAPTVLQAAAPPHAMARGNDMDAVGALEALLTPLFPGRPRRKAASISLDLAIS